MANVVSLHTRQVFLAAGDPAAYGKAYFYQSGTSTQVNVFSDVGLTTQRSQPVVLDSQGVLPPCYVVGADPLRVLITDEDDVNLPSYPQDNIVPLIAEEQDASGTAFAPTAEVPATNVQDAIEYVAAQFTDQNDLLARYFLPYTTGGTGDAYTLTTSPAVTAYATGLSFVVVPDRANTGAATLNVDGVGAVNLMKLGSTGTPQALAAAEIAAYREFRVIYDGTRFLMALGRDFPIRGTGSNGDWTRWPDGTQECRHGPFAMPETGTSNCAATWTFPAAFSSVTNLAIHATLCPSPTSNASTLFSAGAGSISPSEVGAIAVGTVSTTGANIRVYRIQGMDDFGNGDVMYAMLSASGRWY